MPPDMLPAAASHPHFFARFQSFDRAADGAEGHKRVTALREVLAAHGLDACVVARADAHQNEYVPEREERLAWLTGFTGSAGQAVILEQEAALFVDGRYTLQALAEVDTSVFTVVPLAETSPAAWIEAHLPKGAALGFDTWRTTSNARARLAQAVAHAGARLVGVDRDLFEAIWTDRPPPPRALVRLLDLAFAGVHPAVKLDQLRARLTQERVDGLLVSDPHAIAWLFNLRGGDVRHTPLALAWALVPRQGRPTLFIDPGKVSDAVRGVLEEVTDLAPVERLAPDLAAFAPGHVVRLDQDTAPVVLANLVEGAGGQVSSGVDPLSLLKASKNAAEIAGMRAAHIRDAVALARFLHWFETVAPGGALSEIDAVEALETFRRETSELQDISFPTIAGAGPNGAIVHYRVTRATNRRIAPGDMFLIDSGAQYPDGTTDVTRTLIVGAPTAQMKQRYTLVLKGHVALAGAVFPTGTSGAQLDALARQFLWAAGLDFDHGTGHGVGAGLSVHEGPANISKRGHVPLADGMILSNEPGYYKAGAYGIRIENLILVEPRAPEEGERESLGFSTLTLVPYARDLIDLTLLTSTERAFIDAYHRQVAQDIGPRLDGAARDWLISATAPL